MSTVATRRVKSSEIRVGDVVREHGMRVRIDDVRQYAGHNGSELPVYSCPGTVLNMDEVRAAGHVPLCLLTRDEWADGQGWTVSRRDAWTVQGNDLAEWFVEVRVSLVKPAAPIPCARSVPASALRPGSVIVITGQEWTVTETMPGTAPYTIRVTLRSAGCRHCRAEAHSHSQIYGAGEWVTTAGRVTERDVLTLTATLAEPGALCSGHRDEIPAVTVTEGGPYIPAYADGDGWLWCLACAKHMTACDDADCGHPRAVFADVPYPDDVPWGWD